MIGRAIGEGLAPILGEGRTAMKNSRVWVAAACAVALLGTAPAAFAQGGGGGRRALVAGPAFAYPYAFYDPFFYYPYDSYYSDDSSFPHYPDGYLSSDESAPTYSTSWSSMVEPDQTNMGGMSFDVTPANAEVFADNMRVGTVGQFTPTTQPVGLPAGHHHIEIRTPGYQTISFDVDIVAGEVTPFQGMMERD